MRLSAAVELSERYITNRFLPDKAIDLMDEAASKTEWKLTLNRRTRCFRPKSNATRNRN
jgi:ATP-dependent Clp protease ATP-binding subunit ClpA